MLHDSYQVDMISSLVLLRSLGRFRCQLSAPASLTILPPCAPSSSSGRSSQSRSSDFDGRSACLPSAPALPCSRVSSTSRLLPPALGEFMNAMLV
eukprot:765270-Hanusia_phi.AAC.9